MNDCILSQFEQILSECIGKGTNLGICDLWSAMASGYFIENRGAIMPAVEQYLTQQLDCPNEIARRSRRASKALSNGSYSLEELIMTVHTQLMEQNGFEPTKIQEYTVVPVDIVAYQRPTAKKIKTKSYSSKHRKAVPAIPFGVIATQGKVDQERVAIIRGVSYPDIDKNDRVEQMQEVYKVASQHITTKDVGVFDAGFSLADALNAGIKNCVVRLANNKTFGATEGKIPPRKSKRGKAPTKYKAEIIRPLARKHKGNILGSSPPTYTQEYEEDGKLIKIQVWENLYFLESHLKKLTKKERKRLRSKRLLVIAVHHPDYKNPLLLGTAMSNLQPENMYQIYTNRWPIEGIPQVGKRILSGGGGRHFTHCENSNFRLPVFSMLVGTMLKVIAANNPAIATGFWDKKPKATFGRLMKRLKKVGIALSTQLFKKESQTKHLPVGFEARLTKT